MPEDYGPLIDAFRRLPPAEQQARLSKLEPDELKLFEEQLDAHKASPKPQVAGPQWSQVSPQLLQQRREISRMEAESNMPESTTGTRTREAVLGIFPSLESLSNAVRSGGQAGLDLLTLAYRPSAVYGEPGRRLWEFGSGLVHSATDPVVNYAQALRRGDYDAAANAAGSMLSQTVPAVAGATEAVTGPIRVGPTFSELPGVGALREKALQFQQNRLGASPFRTTERIFNERADRFARATKAQEEAHRTAQEKTAAEQQGVAEKQTEANRVAQEKTAENQRKVAEQLQANREATATNARRDALERSVDEGSTRLGQRVADLDAKVRQEANAKYDVVRQAVAADPGVPLADLAQKARHAEQNILKGSAENIKQFRELARKAPEEELIHTSVGDVRPGDPLYEALRSQGAIDVGGTIPFDQLQGYSSEIGRRLARGGLDGDVYQALKYLKGELDKAKTTIADRNGAGVALRDADSFWRSYMDLFYDSDSALAKVREGVGTKNPSEAFNEFMRGKADEIAIRRLRQLPTEHAGDAIAIADLASNLKSASTELANTRAASVKPVEKPERVAPKTVPPARRIPPEPVEFPPAPTVRELEASKRYAVRTTAESMGRLRSHGSSLRTLSAPIRWVESWHLQRPAVLDAISKLTSADLAAVDMLPEPMRATVRANIQEALRRERAAGREPTISPAVRQFLQAGAAVSGGVQNRREAMERLGRNPAEPLAPAGSP